jgi:hypothetical protein
LRGPVRLEVWKSAEGLGAGGESLC